MKTDLQRLSEIMILPGPTDRFLILGPTGGGKSKLAEKMLHMTPDDNLTNIIVDFKAEWPARPQDLVASSIGELEKALDETNFEDDRRDVVYRVPNEHKLRENCKQLDKVAFLAMERTHVRLYYDELKYVANGTDYETRAPNFFYAITTGRSKFVPVWMATWRPAWIPVSCLSESDVRASFYLRMRADRAVAGDLLGEDVPWSVLRKERFSYYMATDIIEKGPLRLSKRSVLGGSTASRLVS